jgi:hypothetical protein
MYDKCHLSRALILRNGETHDARTPSPRRDSIPDLAHGRHKKGISALSCETTDIEGKAPGPVKSLVNSKSRTRLKRETGSRDDHCQSNRPSDRRTPSMNC